MPENQLNPKVALITGAARRIGAVIARALHAAGMNVVLHYNASKEDATILCDEFNKNRPGSAFSVSANLSELEIEKSIIDQSLEGWGRLDVLVNNASRFYKTPMGEVTDFAWDDLININLKAPFFLSQAARPYLAQTQGSIVNITDIYAERPLRDYSVYCISKSGLVMMTKVLAKEFGPDIRVNAVAPSVILWPEGENALSPAQKEKIITKTALLRPGEPEDIAKAVLYFVHEAGYVTGQVLNVDGGRLLS